VNKDIYFEGTETDNKEEDTMVIVTCRYVQYLIYKSRHRKKIPSMVYVYEEVQNFLTCLREKGKWTRVVGLVPNLMGQVLGVV
jgi:hypothetical protein